MAKKLLLLLLLTPLFSMAQHTISGTFSPAVNYKWGILYQVTPTGTLYTADTQIDEKGHFTMPLDTTVVQGSIGWFMECLPKPITSNLSTMPGKISI